MVARSAVPTESPDLAIYKAYSQGRGWGNVEQFLYNNSEISVGHPALVAGWQAISTS
jgi:hypothetical protein